MADFDNLDYFEKGFDPASLTVPRIRSILVSHDVSYPAAAKKPQLIQIFNDEVLPQRKKILAARAKVRRMSKGIMDADSQDSIQDSNLTEEEEEQELPQPRKSGRTARPSRAKTEESDLEVLRTRSPTKRGRPPRASVPTPAARSSDSETTEKMMQSIIRKSRRSETAEDPTPHIKTEDVDQRPNANRRESNFTYDNPFQSGSSPSDRHVSVEKKRKSLAATGTKELARRKSGTNRQSGVGAGDRRKASASYEVPIEQLNGVIDVDENGVIADEEFTPEAQLELLQEQSLKGVDALGPRRPTQRRGFNWKLPAWIAVLSGLAAHAGYYRHEKIEVGYCGVGRSARQIFPDSISVPHWAQILAEPECEVCPQHAYCYRDMETRCETDFVLKPHPLSFGGLVPLPPTCEPDGEKVRKVKAVADRAVEELRERRAKFECGDLPVTEAATKPTPDIGAEDLKKEVSQKRRRGMTEAEFNELWAGAIGEIEGREEVVKSGDGTHRLLTSTSLARLPLGCTIRRSFRLALARYRLEIIALTFIIGLYFYVRSTISSRNKANAAVPNLVAVTLDRLATQASLHAADKEGYPESWISIGQLRDDVLRDEFSLNKREAVWQKVRKVVEMNANVRASQREGRNGEISRVWEWIGAVGELESGGRRRKSGRVSWGVYDNSSPVSGVDEGPEVVQRKWEESRPIY